MKSYKALKGTGLTYILLLTLLYNVLILALLFFINSYEFSSIVKATLVCFNIYQLYYICIALSLKYTIDDKSISITGAFGLKKVIIPIEQIQAYTKSSGSIKGVKLYGYGRNNFDFGKSIIDTVGTAHMFVTSSKNIIYIKTEDMVYGISPDKCENFESDLSRNNILCSNWESKINKNINLYKDKKFIIPFFVVAVVILILTINPFVMYLNHSLPAKMPMQFDAAFNAVKFGSGKQFAFKQMVFGVLNMALLFCMYYAAYFYARYDKKSAYKFMYISLVTASVFLIMQLRILCTF